MQGCKKCITNKTSRVFTLSSNMPKVVIAMARGTTCSITCKILLHGHCCCSIGIFSFQLSHFTTVRHVLADSISVSGSASQFACLSHSCARFKGSLLFLKALLHSFLFVLFVCLPETSTHTSRLTAGGLSEA